MHDLDIDSLLHFFRSRTYSAIFVLSLSRSSQSHVFERLRFCDETWYGVAFAFIACDIHLRNLCVSTDELRRENDAIYFECSAHCAPPNSITYTN